MKKSHLSRNTRKKLFAVENLEPRILLSADPIVTELVQQYHNANSDYLGALQVSASTVSENNLLKQNSQENAALNLDFAKAKTQNFALNTINVENFSRFQNTHGQIVIGSENSNAIINLGDSKTNNGKLAFNQDLLISNPQAGGEIFIKNDLVGGANAGLTLNGSGHTTILSADISTAAGSNVTINDSLKVSGTRIIDSGASIQLGSSSNHFLDGDGVTGDDKLTLKAAATTGNIVVKGIVGGTDPLESLTVTGTGNVPAKVNNVTFENDVTVNGDVIIDASGTVTFNAALNITNGHLKINGASLIVFNNNVVVNNGKDIFLEGDEITFNGGQESVRGTGTLTIRPTITSYDISIGSPPAENTQNTLNITSSELFTLREGFSKIIIGHETTGHTTTGVSSVVYLGSKAANQNTFFDALEIYGNKIQIDDFFNPDFKFQTKSTIKLDAISDITIKNEVKANDGSSNKNITVYSANGNVKQISNDGDALSRESIIAADLAIDVATDIDLGFVSATNISAKNGDTSYISLNSTAPTTVTSTITALTARIPPTSATLKTTGNITFSSDVNSLIFNTALTTTSGAISVKTGLLTAANTASSITNGALTILQAVSTTLGTMTLEAYSNLTLNNTVSTTGSSALSFKSTTGKILQNFDITSNAGSAITLTAGDNIEMLDTKTIFTTGIITLTAGKDAKISVLNSTTTVNITATNGAITDNLTAETPNILGATTSATLTAKIGIGAAGAADINTTITNLTATNGATGGIFINETDALTISGSGVKQDGGTGSIVITNASDNPIIVDGDVNNTGSGHILIKAQDKLTLNRLIKSSSGNISLLSDTDLILFSATGGVETAGTASSVDIDAALAITMTGGSTIKSGGGNVRLNARAGNIALSYLDAKTGKVSLLTTNSYRILDNDTTDDIDVIAGGLRMNSYSIGQDSSGVINHLEIDTTDLSVYTISSLFLTEATGLTVKSIEAITVKRVNADGSTFTDQTDATQSDLVSTTNGAIVLTATTGDIVIQDGNANNQGILANGSGNILINAATGNLRIEAPINSGSGHINLLSGATLTQTAEGDVTTISGTIDVNAATAIVMADGAATQTTNQSIRYKAGSGDITLGYLATYGDSTSMGDIAILAGGKIMDADTTGFDIRTKTLYLAAAGVATGENPLEITVETLSAKADAGGMFLSQTGTITIDRVSTTVFRVGTDGVISTSQTESGSDLITTGNGAIVLNATDIVLKDGDANGKVISGQGNGNILLNASAGSLTFYASLTSTSGNISLLAAKDVLLNSASQVTTGFPSSATTLGNPSIDIEAGQVITMAIGSQIQTGNGNLRLVANSGDITLGFISAGIGNISLISTGKILDSNENNVDVVAKGLRIYASDVGLNTNSLDVNVSILSAGVWGSAGLFINESDNVTIGKIDDLTVNRVDTKASISNKTDLTQSDLISLGNGSLILSAPLGAITVLDGNENGTGIDIKNGGQLLLNASDTIDLEANILTNQGNVSLLSTKRIIQTANADVITGGTIDYNALTTITLEDGANISTQGANIRLFAGDTLSFSGVDAREGNVSLIAKMLLDAGDSTFDVRAKNLRINAELGAGTSKNALDINVENLTAIASTNGLFLNEADGLTVTKLSEISVKRVGQAGEINLITDPEQSNLTTSTGAIVLTTKAGNITVLEGKSDRKGIVTQSGNVLLNAVGNLTLQAGIETISSPIQLIAGDTFSQLENGYLLGGSTIDVSAKNAIVMNAGSVTKTSSDKDIQYQTATGDITISLIDAGKGNVALLSGNKILDNFKSTPIAGLIAAGANLTAVNAIGIGDENANPLEIDVPKLTIKTGSGGAFITNSNAITVDLVAVITQQIDSEGIATTGQMLAESDLKSLNNGSIILNAPQITLQDGDKNGKAITLDGRGNLLLNASSAGIDINAAISATSGNISLLATNENSKLLINAGISTTGSGSIDLETRSDILMTKDVKISGEGNIRLNTEKTIVLGNVTTLESVSLIGDKILTSGNGNNVSAKSLRINAGNVGMSDKPITTNVNLISANITKDGMFLAQENALTIGLISDIKINRIANNGSVIAVIDKKQSDITVEKGNVVIANQQGDITIVDGDTNGKGIIVKQGNLLLSAVENLNIQTGIENMAGNVILTNKSGNITLSTGDKTGKGIVLQKGNLLLSAAGNLVIQVGIENTAGNISLMSGALFTQSEKGNITNSGGTIDVIATQGILMSDGTSTKTDNKTLRYKSDGDINLSVLNAGDGCIAVISRAAITNVMKANKVNVLANSLNINAKAIGNADAPINVTLKKISAVTGAGGFFVSSANDLSVEQVDEMNVNQVQMDGSIVTDKIAVLRGITTSENGSIVLSANNLTINRVLTNNATQNDKNIFVNGTGNLLLKTKTNLDLLSGITVQKGSMSLIAAGTISQSAKGKLTVSGSGSLSLQAKEIVQAQSTKSQTSGGNIRLEADSITLGIVNAGKGDISLIASKQIVDSGKTISLTANQLKITASSAGLGKNPLDVKVNSLSAEIGQGGLFVNTASKLAINETSAIISNSVTETGQTEPVTDNLQTGVISSDNGVILISSQGNLVVTKHVNASGNLLLESRAGSLAILAKVENKQGAVSLAAGNDLKIGDIQISNAKGTIDVQSQKNLLMSDGATIQTQDAMILLSAKDKLQITGIDAGESLVTLIASTIVDAGDKNTDVTANDLHLNGVNGVGIRSNPLDINVSRLSAEIEKNTLFVNELNSLHLDATPTMNITRIASNGEETNISDSAKNNIGRSGISLLNNSSISLLATSDIFIDSRIKSISGGNISLQSATGTIFQNATVETSGDLKLLAPKGIVQSTTLAKIVTPLNTDSQMLISPKQSFYAWTESVTL